MGPRGTAVLERLVAASTTHAWRGRIDVHLIDPHVGLGGSVWRHDQSPVLLMNTATSQTTQYPDETCHPTLPTPHGETLADHAAAAGIAPTQCAPPGPPSAATSLMSSTRPTRTPIPCGCASTATAAR